LLDLCEGAWTEFDRLLERATREWQDVLSRLSELRSQNEAATAFASRTFSEAMAASCNPPVIRNPDLGEPLDDTLNGLDRVSAEVDAFKSKILAALQARWDEYSQETGRLQQRVRSTKLKPPALPAASAPWTEWGSAMELWEQYSGALATAYR